MKCFELCVLAGEVSLSRIFESSMTNVEFPVRSATRHRARPQTGIAPVSLRRPQYEDAYLQIVSVGKGPQKSRDRKGADSRQLDVIIREF
jgi:hypothetical protein